VDSISKQNYIAGTSSVGVDSRERCRCLQVIGSLRVLSTAITVQRRVQQDRASNAMKFQNIITPYNYCIFNYDWNFHDCLQAFHNEQPCEGKKLQLITRFSSQSSRGSNYINVLAVRPARKSKQKYLRGAPLNLLGASKSCSHTFVDRYPSAFASKTSTNWVSNPKSPFISSKCSPNPPAPPSS